MTLLRFHWAIVQQLDCWLKNSVLHRSAIVSFPPPFRFASFRHCSVVVPRQCKKTRGAFARLPSFLDSVNTYLCQFSFSWVNCLHSRRIHLQGATHISIYIYSVHSDSRMNTLNTSKVVNQYLSYSPLANNSLTNFFCYDYGFSTVSWLVTISLSFCF